MSNDHVQVSITVDNVGITRNGYGMPLIASHNATFPDRIRFYSASADVGADGFASDSPERLAANAFFAQTPKPPLIAIARMTGSVTQRYEIEAKGVNNSFAYGIRAQGEGVTDTDTTYTSDSAATAAEIHNGLVTALNAVTGKNYTAALAALVYADNTFVGEADDDTLTMAAALVYVDQVFTAEADTEVFTKTAHTLLTGDGPFQVSNGGGALPAGLLALTDYWVIRIDDDTFYLANTLAEALAGTHLSITTDGTGTQTISDTAETRRVVAHTLLTGDGPFQVSTTGGLPTGLVAATDYWVIKLGTYTFKLASTLALALAGTSVALTTDGTGVQTIADTGSTARASEAFTVTADAAGDWFSLAVTLAARAYLSIKQTHAAPTGTSLSDDLDAILLEDGSWYQLHTLYNSSAYVLAAAAWVASNERTYAFDVNEYDVINVAYGAATDDTGKQMLDLGYSSAMGSYHPRPAAMFSAGWMGVWLPTDPGAATAKFKSPEGVETVKLTSTQKTNIRARRMNSYTTEFGKKITWEGTVFSTTYRYLDVRRDVDWLTDEVTKSVFGTISGAPKVPYTPEGIAQVGGAVRGSVALAIARDVLAEGTTQVETPNIEDVEDADKADRVLRNVKFSGTLTGAIHAVIPVSGVVTF